FLLAERGRKLAGILIVALAVAIKLPAVVGLAILGWNWPGPGANWVRRCRGLLGAFLVGIVVLVGLSSMSSLGNGWVWALTTPGRVRSWLAPSTALGLALGKLCQALGFGNGNSALTATRLLGVLAGGVVVGVVVMRSSRLGPLHALGIALL